MVENETFIQVLKSGDTKKYVAEVSAVDHDCDLAILTVTDKKFFSGTLPLSFGGIPDLGYKVKVYGFPMGGEKLSITEGVVSRIEVGRYAHSLKNFLLLQIDAAINPGNSGGPVLSDNKIVGVAFQMIGESHNIGYAVPVTIIDHFLTDLKNKKYGGFPALGIDPQKLENDTYRKMLGMADDQTGIVVNRVFYDSAAWGNIKENDVILSIDGIKIGNDNTVPYGKNSRVDSSYLISSKYVGDAVNIRVLRDKKTADLSFPLSKKRYIIPRAEYDTKPSYYIFGGIVFTTLTGDYLFKLGNNLFREASSLYSKYFNDIATPQKQEVVIVQQILSDELNIGYDDCVNGVVEKVNGSRVSDIKDLIKKIQDCGDDYIVIELEYKSCVVLDRKKCMENNPDLLKRYKIPADRSENLM